MKRASFKSVGTYLIFGIMLGTLSTTGCSLPGRGKVLPGITETVGGVSSHSAEPNMAQGRVALLLAMAQSSEQQGDTAKAIGTYRDVLQLEENAIALHRLAVLHDQQGESSEAQQYFRRALKQNPNVAELHADFGYSCYLSGNSQEAEAELRQSIQQSPTLARAHNNLGLVLARTGRYEESLECFRLAGCGQSDAFSNLGFACLLEARWDDARQHFQSALSLPSPPASANRGLQILQGLFDESRNGELTSSHRSGEPTTNRLADRRLSSGAGLADNSWTELGSKTW